MSLFLITGITCPSSTSSSMGGSRSTFVFSRICMFDHEPGLVDVSRRKAQHSRSKMGK